MSPQRFTLNIFATFLFVSAINASSIRATQCPAFRVSSILSNHSAQYPLPVESGFHMKSPKSSHEEKIVGGQETSPNQFPFMAYIEGLFWNGDSIKCGGTLISNRWILTAAHCTYGGVVKVTITLGAHDVSPGSSDQHQLTYTLEAADAQSSNYPGWFLGKVEDDISLIKLPQDVTLNQWIQPARLPYSDDPKQVGDSVVMAGWGISNVDGSGVSPTLRQVNTTVIPYTTCQQTAGVGNFIDEKIICGDGTQGAHYCYGDDGGPMIDYREDEQESFVIGVAWFGDKTTSCQSSNKPNLHARVSNYVDWIHYKTEIPIKFNCKNKENGLYPVPDLTCTKYFYYCLYGFTYLYECPVASMPTIFYYDLCACDYPENVPGCSGYTGEQEMTTRAYQFQNLL